MARRNTIGQPRDIHDILGITVVVYFESQRDKIADALSQANALQGFCVSDRDSKKEGGYYAVHMKVSGTAPGFFGLLAELQVKTLLHDGWAAKTHDLTYKPQIELSSDISVHMKILGDAVQLVEQQSDIIRGLIDRAVNNEKKRRKGAQERLMSFMTEPSSPGYDPEAAKLALDMFHDLGQLRLCRDNDPCLARHFEGWKSYKAKKRRRPIDVSPYYIPGQ
jgi:ppGpp synthetase/RelA/SpoT-type nucleotidyltranferase